MKRRSSNTAQSKDNYIEKLENSTLMITKKRKINTFIEYPGNDWIISAEKSVCILSKLLDILLKSNNCHSIIILIPGVGLSSLPIELFQLGYSNLILCDIENCSIEKQSNDFISHFGSVPSSIRLIQCDVVADGFKGIEANSIDLIVDKGFMDVFLRQNSSQRVWQNLKAVLKSTGIFIIFSIFHKKWRRYVSKSFISTALYASIEVKRYSKTRPSISSFSCPGTLLVAQNSTRGVDELMQLSMNEVSPFRNFHTMKLSELPMDADSV